MAHRIALSVSVAVLFASCCFAEELAVDLASKSEVQDGLQNGAVGPGERQRVIREMFARVGCTAEEQRVDKRSGNVICTLQGETSSTIVIGGHFDFADRGKGIVDDWSGASLLPWLYQTLKTRRRQHTYIFIAFAAEERGLIGSSLYVKRLTAEEKSRVRAFINLECLGLTPVKVWGHRSTPALVAGLAEVAGALEMPLASVNVEQVGDDDTHPFLRANIPVISIHSVTQETFRILHSERDNIGAVHLDDYYNAYRLVAFYLAYLDAKIT